MPRSFNLNLLLSETDKSGMRNLVFILVSIFLMPAIESLAQFPCGTGFSENQLIELQKFNFETAFRKAPEEDTFYIPVKAHIIRKSDGSEGLSLQKFQKELDSVNFFYKNSKIQFVLCGQINYINNSVYRTFNAPEEEDLLTQSAEVPRVINIFFTDTLLLNGKRICGYSFLPIGPNNIFIDNACVNSGNTVAHEIGHYFSLIHTHGSSNTELTNELVSGSNCAMAGDLICDTPADPNLEGKVSYNIFSKRCIYTGKEKDADGAFFKPSVDNIMSYSRPQCTNSFTPGQYLAIRNSLFFHGRTDLICTSENEVIVENSISAIYPNPFVDYFFVFYQLISDSRVTLTLFDMAGKQISILHDATEPRGNLKLFYPWKNTFLHSGMYFLKMEVNERLVSVKKIARIN